MGILNFSKFLQKHAPNCCYEYPLEAFRGKRIAIDMHGLIFQMMFGATTDIVERTDIAQERPDVNAIERKTLDMILNRLEVLMYYGITPVCAFDGKSHPMKQRTHNKRKIEREKNRDKLLEAETKLYSADPIFRTQILVNEYKKRYKSRVEPRWEFISQLKDVLISSGFPVVSAQDFPIETKDAEGLCAALCMPGNDHCFAAVSEDSDFHVYGGNIELIEIYQKYVTKDDVRSTVYYAKVRTLERILMESGLSFEQFRDLCIMMGTDYNPNIPNVGEVKTWNYITQYGSVAALSMVMDVSPLCYPEVVKIYASPICKIELTLTQLSFDETRFRERGREVFDTYGMKDHTSTILNLLSGIATIKGASVTTGPRRDLLKDDHEESITGLIEL